MCIGPKISIIIPCYNVERYLQQCLDSIIPQIVEETQIICVNDGSQDGTLSILQEYARKCTGLTVVDLPHSGVSAARNAGLDAASGEYIAWIDPDDYVSDHWFSSVNNVIEKVFPDVIQMDTVKFCEKTQHPQHYGRVPGWIDRNVYLDDVIRDIRIQGGFPDKVIRATLFQEKRFDTGLKTLEDYDLIPQVLLSAQSVYYVPECLYYYRQHEESLLHQSTQEVTWMSVEAGFKRLKKTEPQFRNAAITAAAWQAFLFYWAYCLEPEVDAQKLSICSRFIRGHLPVLLCDQEIDQSLKCKWIVLSLGLYRIGLRLQNWVRRIKR